MVLEFGLLKSGLFAQSEATGEGVASQTQTTIIRQVLDGAFAGPYIKSLYDSGSGTLGGLIVYTRLIWNTCNSTDVRRTTDGGVTWIQATTQVNSTRIGSVSRITNTKAVALSNAAATGGYTSDSGDVWTAATFPAGWANSFDVEFTTGTVAIAVGARGTAARCCIRSTDSGATWVLCTTGPTATSVLCLTMYDENTGYCVDSSLNIWKTTNAGVDWTDTTFNVATVGANGSTQTMLAVSATRVVYVDHANAIQLYVDGSAPTTVGFAHGQPATASNPCSQFVKAANGNIYFFNTSYVSPVAIMRLWKSMDNGATWGFSLLPVTTPSALICCRGTLDEYDTNKLLVYLGSGKLFSIDVANDTTLAVA